MIIKLQNGAAFRVDLVRCWDHWPETKATLRIHLGEGVLFGVHSNDSPGPAQVCAMLERELGPLAEPSPKETA